MKELIIEPTKTTFSVNFDFSQGVLKFSGNSYPENAYEFFQPLIDKLKVFLKDFRKSVKVVFVVNYFNTSSSKYMFKIMELIDQHKRKGNDVEVLWHFIPGEEDMLETWSDLMNELDLSFEIINV